MMWRKVKLGDIAEFSNGINFDKGAYSKGVKLINVSNFGNRFSPEYNSLDEIKGEVVRNNDLLSTGDIVFVRSNGNKELVGRCMLIDNPPDKITYSGFCIRARFKDTTDHDPVFWTYHFKNMAFRRAMSGTAIGANIQNLSQGRLAVYETMVPNIEGQKRIANILSAYDNLIENNQKQIKLLEEAAQRLYKEWFVDLRFPGHEDAAIIDGVPEGWIEDTIDSKIDLLSGYAFKSAEFNDEGTYRIVTIKNVKDGQFDGDNVSHMVDIPPQMPEHCKLSDGDILLSLTGNVGRVCIVHGDNYLLNQRVAKIKSDNPTYAYCLFRSKDMFDEMNNLANGAAQQNLSPIRTGKIKVVFPTDELIDTFEEIVSPMIEKITMLNKTMLLLSQARDRLLPKLMSGEIEV
ncbi:MAG TPA: restriction endonuclease subunit S [Candidatus Fimimorpha faecalis]|uniref:Restriction endonuclease subunit S n=1 Tax=Candidatus Fimimorpha faecalis TaxID=2840824 RepID=A0A9D1EGT7_9FIRM|nr:restriction endonuclease subunit S [Candidatus Fimimorpha faecalis]